VLTDLIQIKRLGEQKRPENERLRRHMKSFKFVERRLVKIAEEIEGQIECLECGNCCRVATAKLIDRDIEKLMKFVGVGYARFLKDYSTESEEEGLILKRDEEKGCVFLNGNECTVYAARPTSCQHFPHLTKGPGSLVSRMWEMPDRACYCPIVYNTLEAWKPEVKFK
jgi:Fe-S-cluster containining protein